MGCYNCRPTANGGKSIHGEGRASDEGTPRFPNGSLNLAWNTRYGDFLVKAAPDLGIQRVIGWGPRADGTTGPREWDSRLGERLWERYSGPLHQDHNHVEFCWDAALGLTESQVEAAIQRYWYGQEDWLTMATEAEVQRAFEKALNNTVVPELKRLIIGYFSADGDAVKAAVGRGQSLLDVEANQRSYLKQIRDNTAEGATDTDPVV